VYTHLHEHAKRAHGSRKFLSIKLKVLRHLYVGDIISPDGKHDKNIKSRRNRGLGKINEMMQILNTLFFEKYYFEVALVLR
jgi:hypothetical protein